MCLIGIWVVKKHANSNKCKQTYCILTQYKTLECLFEFQLSHSDTYASDKFLHTTRDRQHANICNNAKQDWFAQNVADRPGDPTYGVPFMMVGSVFVVLYLYLFFSREARLGRLGPDMQRAVTARAEQRPDKQRQPKRE